MRLRLNLFSPSRLEIKDRQTRATNCLGRMIPEHAGSTIGTGQYRRWGQSQDREPLVRRTANLSTFINRRNFAMGRPVVIGLGTLIILLLVVAFLF